MERFLGRLIPYLPSCPEAVIKAEVLKTAISFCKDSWIWSVTEEKIIEEGGDGIVFTPPDNSRIIGVQLSDTNDREITKYTRDEATVTLDNAVNITTTVKAKIYLASTQTANALPDFLYEDWTDAIESGTKRSLFMMPGMPWSNMNMVAVEQARYLHELGEARLRVRKQNYQTTITVKMRPLS